MLNIDEVLRQIEKDFPEERVAGMLDEEIFSGNWLPVNWQDDGYEDEYECYSECGRGEAENVVVKELIQIWKNKYAPSIEIDEIFELKLYEEIKSLYLIL